MFDIVTYTDFYEMLVDDFDDFMREQHSSRRAFHCILEAYHLREWVWHDWIENDDAAQAALGVRSEAEFNALLNRSCVWLPFFRAMVNGTKHFEAREMPFEAFRVAAMPFAFDDPKAGFDTGDWRGPIRYVSGALPVGPQGKGYLVFDLGEAEGDGRYVYVTHVIEAVVRFWRDFFRRLRPDITVRSSQHHVD
jgi:hypothetical protein